MKLFKIYERYYNVAAIVKIEPQSDGRVGLHFANGDGFSVTPEIFEKLKDFAGVEILEVDYLADTAKPQA